MPEYTNFQDLWKGYRGETLTEAKTSIRKPKAKKPSKLDTMDTEQSADNDVSELRRLGRLITKLEHQLQTMPRRNRRKNSQGLRKKLSEARQAYLAVLSRV